MSDEQQEREWRCVDWAPPIDNDPYFCKVKFRLGNVTIIIENVPGPFKQGAAYRERDVLALMHWSWNGAQP